MKKCACCGETKTRDDFVSNRSTKDGLHSYCKQCVRDKAKKWHAENPGWRAEYLRKWRRDNPEKDAIYTKRWIEKNEDRRKEYVKRWNEENRERINFLQRERSKKNRDKQRVYENNRYERIKSSPGKLSSDIVNKLMKLQRGKCPCCGEPLGDDYHIDHIIPLSLGGSNTDENVQLLRAKCNLQKHSKHPIDFMRERGFLL